VAPLALLILSSLLFAFCLGRRIGWERIIRQSMETSQRVQSLSAEQRAGVERTMGTQVAVAAVMAYVGAAVGGPLVYLVSAGVLLLLVNTMGAGLRFRQAWAVVVYAMLPSLLSAGAGLAVMYLKEPDEFNIRNPSSFNPGAYLEPQAVSKFVHSLATSLDLFAIWIVVLLAVGFSSAAHRLSFGKALAAVALPWAAMVFVRAGAAALFG
jgi:hypothetical protein